MNRPAQQQQQRRGGPPAQNPGIFNRVARLQRHKAGAVTYNAGRSGNLLDLPNVGYHYRVHGEMDITLATHATVVAGRFRSGHYGATAARFPAPHGLVPRIGYALNVGTPIWSTDGYGCHILSLMSNQGMNPVIQVATGDTGYLQKEIILSSIYNSTDAAFVKPDAVTAAAKTYRLRHHYQMPLALGDAAAAGLIPVQDQRVRPQFFIDWGGKADVLSTTADVPNEGTGQIEVIVDYFTVPSPDVRPDTDYIYQTRMDILGISGTGESVYKPQLGGIIMQIADTLWNVDKAMRPSDIDGFQIRFQQGQVVESIYPWLRIADERKFYGKRLPDEVYAWDGSTGLGDPTTPSLRDRINSNGLTALELTATINSGVTITQQAERRIYLKQLVSLPRGM